VAGLLLTGIFPRVLSDHADRELSQLYPDIESHLPVHAKAALPETTIHEEGSH
jgi:hypothetical protein